MKNLTARAANRIAFELQKLSEYPQLLAFCSASDALRTLDDYLRKRELIRFVYRGIPLVARWESTALAHIIRSTPKLERLVQAAKLPERPVIFDVGASNGHFSALVRAHYPGAVIHAFEPCHLMRDALRENIGRHDGGHVYECGIADAASEREFFFDQHSTQTSSLFEVSAAYFSNTLQRSTVLTDTLDSFAARYGIDHIDLLKVDVQGAEPQLLAGAALTLGRVRQAIFEISFLDAGVETTFASLTSHFGSQKPINSVAYGADVLFSREPS